MSCKENLKAKIRLDRIFQSLVSTVREPPGRRWLDNEAPRSKLQSILAKANEEDLTHGFYFLNYWPLPSVGYRYKETFW